jgi:hypothetical protein
MDPWHAVTRALQINPLNPISPNLQHAVVSAEDAHIAPALFVLSVANIGS